jgi:two-component system sensor histidine kinase DegS
VKRNVVMILKETVSNALKHAGARTISVKLRIGTRELALHVEDDGAGFDTSADRSHGNGLGNLRKRSEAIGGTLEVESDGAGTRYALRVPLPSPTFMRDT